MVPLPTFDALELEAEGEWLTVWFNEPERRNPLTGERIADLDKLCEWLEGSDEIRGVTFRGQGGIFCAGGDLKAFKAFAAGTITRDQIEAMSKTGGHLFHRIEALPQVTVMAIEGGAVAGGIGLACAGDVVVCEESAKLSLTEVKIGLVPAQIAPFIIRRTGSAVARRLMVTAAMFDGAEAARIGIADVACKGTETLGAEVARIRETVLQGAPGAISDTKRLVRDLDGKDRTEQIEIAAEVFAGRILSEEGAEGLASFAAKRKPSWADGDGS